VNSAVIGCAYPLNENSSKSGKHTHTENSFPGLPMEYRTGRRIRLPQGASTNLLKANFFYGCNRHTPSSAQKDLYSMQTLFPANAEGFTQHK
jgi:hypothetical protein